MTTSARAVRVDLQLASYLHLAGCHDLPPMTTSAVSENDTLVQIASYNTNLQGSLGLPQDLVDWLSPTLQVSTFLSRAPRAPDIIAVGFQELLPLHLGRMFLFFTQFQLQELIIACSSLWEVQVCYRRQERAHLIPNRSQCTK